MIALKKAVAMLIERKAEAIRSPGRFSKDNPTKLAYYTLQNRVLGRQVVGRHSRRVYTIQGVGYHLDEQGQYRPGYCPGFVITDATLGYHVHVNLIDWQAGPPMPI